MFRCFNKYDSMYREDNRMEIFIYTLLAYKLTHIREKNLINKVHKKIKKKEGSYKDQNKKEGSYKDQTILISFKELERS